MQTPKIQTLEPGDRARIAAVLRAHSVTRPSLFSSFARGTQTDQSDLDLLIEPKEGATLLDLARLELARLELARLELARLELALEDLLGHHVDLITYDELRPGIREQALREQEALPI